MNGIARFGLGWGVSALGHRAGHRLDRAQALATPVHVRRLPRVRGCRRASCTSAFARPASLRRHDHRPLVRASRCRLRRWRVVTFVADRHQLHARGRRAGPARSPRWSPPSSSSCSASRGSTSATTTRSTSLVGVAFAVGILRQRLPLLHPERGLPGHLPPGQDGAPRRRRAARRGRPAGRAGPARPDRRGHQAGRARRLRRLDAAAPTVAGDPDTYLFGKLYAMNHVRADRWYKLGRTILYGRLEDEAPFQSVRRLVEYEDYALRLLRDAGIPTAAPYGIVEMTPEREYLLVTEFFDGAEEIGEADVDDDIIDQGLRSFAGSGTPGSRTATSSRPTCSSSDGQVLLIDVGFVQVRPSPWRQAVDLANMMLVLAVRTDADGCTSGRSVLHARRDRRGLRRRPWRRESDAAADRDEAGRRAISSCSSARWRRRDDRYRCSAGTSSESLLTLALRLQRLPRHQPHRQPAVARPRGAVTGGADCGTTDVMILMAQAVPSASSVPCVASLPAGWTLGAVAVERGRGEFTLDSDRAGKKAVVVTLRSRGDCRRRGAPRYRATSRGCAGSSVPSGCRRTCDRAHVPLPRWLCHLPGGAGQPRDVVAAVRHRLGTRVPAPNRAGRRSSRTAADSGSAVPASSAPARRMSGPTVILADAVLIVLLRVVAAIGIAILATVVSLRFLGIRRGWGTALLAGLIGWGGAGALALALNRWNWGADGLAVHVFAIAIPATMAAAVALDLLARPGTLAIGERAGLVSTPRPFRGDRRRVEVLRRYRELVRLARAGRVSVPPGRRGGRCRRRSDRARHPPAARTRGGRRRLHQARADRGHARRPPAARGVRRAGRAAEPGRAGADGIHQGSSGGGARRRGRNGLRRVRLGSPRCRLDRPDLPRPSAIGRGRRREGAASRRPGGHRA